MYMNLKSSILNGKIHILMPIYCMISLAWNSRNYKTIVTVSRSLVNFKGNQKSNMKKIIIKLLMCWSNLIESYREGNVFFQTFCRIVEVLLAEIPAVVKFDNSLLTWLWLSYSKTKPWKHMNSIVPHCLFYQRRMHRQRVKYLYALGKILMVWV